MKAFNCVVILPSEEDLYGTKFDIDELFFFNSGDKKVLTPSAKAKLVKQAVILPHSLSIKVLNCNKHDPAPILLAFLKSLEINTYFCQETSKEGDIPTIVTEILFFLYSCTSNLDVKCRSRSFPSIVPCTKHPNNIWFRKLLNLLRTQSNNITDLDATLKKVTSHPQDGEASVPPIDDSTAEYPPASATISPTQLITTKVLASNLQQASNTGTVDHYLALVMKSIAVLAFTSCSNQVLTANFHKALIKSSLSSTSDHESDKYFSSYRFDIQ